MENKRGDIPVVILVIGVVVLCSLAIASFIISDIKIGKELLGVGLVEEVNSDIEKFHFYQNLGDSNEVAAEKINASIKGNFLIVKRNNDILLIEYRLRLK